MAFNLGAFAGGLVTGGLKTYTTLKEQERADAAEARDKARFEEEQRKIELQRQAEDIRRQATIPTSATSPGVDVNAVASALPIGGSETSPEDLTKTTDAYQQKFKDVFGSLTPHQQALVLRQYGDTATPGGAALQQTQTAAGAPEALAGLNAAVVRQDAGGGRSVVQADTDEKAIIARHKALAMASGNPLAIKDAHEAEATMLNRQVAQQQLAIGEQNIDLNKYKIAGAKNEQDFKDKWTAEMTAAKEDHFKLMKQIDTATSDPNATLDSLVSQFGPKLKDVTGQTYSVKDGKVVTTNADGVATVVASDVTQAVNLLKQAATNNFAQDFQDRILSKGLFEKPADLAAFIKDKQDFFFKTGDLATKQVMAAAATKNAESSATAAAASKQTAQTAADKLAAEIKANLFGAQAEQASAAGAASRAHATYYNAEAGMAKVRATLQQSDLDARKAAQPFLDEYSALTPEDQKGPKGIALIEKAAVMAATKSTDFSRLIRAEGVKPIAPADVAKFVESFGGTASSFKDGNGNAIPIGKLSPAQVMQEMQGMMGGAGPVGSGLPAIAPPPPPPSSAKTSALPAASSAPAYVAPAESPAGKAAARREAAATAQSQAAQAVVDAATKAANAAITANDPAAADQVQRMNGFSSLPTEVKAKISQIVLKSPAAIPVASAPAAPAPAAAAIPAPAAGKSVRAQEEDLSYKVIVAQSTYERRPSATTKAQLDNAQQELATFRKANGLK